MKMDEIVYVLGVMYPGIIGGKDFLIRSSVRTDTLEELGDATIIMWSLPMPKPSQEMIEEQFALLRSGYEERIAQLKQDEEAREYERIQRIVNGLPPVDPEAADNN